MVHNLFWFIASIIGFYAINSRISVSILRFFIFMIFLFLTRIGVYVAMYLTMGEVSINTYQCDAVYMGGLYIMQAIIEGLFFVVMLPMIWAIMLYVKGEIFFLYLVIIINIYRMGKRNGRRVG